MIFFAYGLIGLFGVNKTDSENIVFESKSARNSPTEIKTISIDIEGSVVNPGVYKLSQDSRIQDVFIAAGGLSAQADGDVCC
jgi:DNA uptake protein ComE-like DNA-binding protein